LRGSREKGCGAADTPQAAGAGGGAVLAHSKMRARPGITPMTPHDPAPLMTALFWTECAGRAAVCIPVGRHPVIDPADTFFVIHWRVKETLPADRHIPFTVSPA